jgi:anti-anti-sigma regulatory factor
MFRITEISGDDRTVTLGLEGKVVDAGIPDLERMCIYYRDERDKTVLLDFGGVSFINSTGVRMLERIKDEKIKITNCSPFIRSLLGDLITERRGEKYD